MSILIKGMEMPTDGEAVVLVISNENGKMLAEVDEYCGAVYECVPVQAHGDLIDYDFCVENYELMHDDDENPVYAVRMRDINNAPTIIPAEEGEA